MNQNDLSTCPSCKIPVSDSHKCISCNCNNHVIEGCNFLKGAPEEYWSPSLCIDCHNSGKSENYQDYVSATKPNSKRKPSISRQSSISQFFKTKKDENTPTLGKFFIIILKIILKISSFFVKFLNKNIRSTYRDKLFWQSRWKFSDWGWTKSAWKK